MGMQHVAILSIGSNLGDRLENLRNATNLIHASAATVIRISSVYETPAWCFEGGPFYNAALLVHSHKGPEELLSALLEIENQLGRKRIAETGYASRVIDLDIIDCDAQIANNDVLTLPHPRMHERHFVLRPLAEIVPEWTHPVSGISLHELIANLPQSDMSIIGKKIVPPLANVALDNFSYIAIEGNIGAGKTTLASKIAEDFNAKTVFERFADNPFLPKFYEDQNRYAFPLEMSFLADRYQQISDDLAQFDLFRDFIVADYHIFKSLIFAKVTLTDDEYRLYRKLFEIIYREMPKPGIYIYLYQNTERLLANIRQRGRSYEQDIEASYLEKINRGYLDYIKSQSDLNVLVIDVSDRDFVKRQEDYIFILDQVRAKLEVS